MEKVLRMNEIGKSIWKKMMYGKDAHKSIPTQGFP
jgi:hypothetical protein